MELKYDLNYFMAIEGLDDAVIGTASFSTDGEEVLAYDFDKAVEILQAQDLSKDEVEAWLENSIPDAGTNQPVFVYRDANVREQLRKNKRDKRLLH